MVYNNMGQALSTSERVDEAAAAYARAITLDPTNGVAYRSLTGLHASLGDAPAAAAAARAAIALLPSDAGQWLLLGKAHTWGADSALERGWVRSMRAGLKSASGTSGAPPLTRATWHFALYHGLRGARSRRPAPSERSGSQTSPQASASGGGRGIIWWQGTSCAAAASASTSHPTRRSSRASGPHLNR